MLLLDFFLLEVSKVLWTKHEKIGQQIDRDEYYHQLNLVHHILLPYVGLWQLHCEFITWIL